MPAYQMYGVCSQLVVHHSVNGLCCLWSAKTAFFWQKLDSAEWPRPILTVHVRHGKNAAESDYYPGEDYMAAVKTLQGRYRYRELDE
jgi:hypothetical protein